MNRKEATKTIRITQETKDRLDKTIVIKGETYDKILTRLLGETRYIDSLERAWKRAYETEEAYKKCPTTPADEKAKCLQQSKSARGYLFTLVKNFIAHVEERSK